MPDVDEIVGLLFSWRRQLSLAPFLTRLEGADVPGPILGMDGAEPPTADAAVGRCGRIAGHSSALPRPTQIDETEWVRVVGLGRVELPTNGLEKQCPVLIGSENF